MIQQSTLQNILSHLSHSLGQSRGIQQQTGQVISQCLRKLQLAIHFQSIVISSGQTESSTSCDYTFYEASSISIQQQTIRHSYQQIAHSNIYLYILFMQKQGGEKSSMARLKEQAQNKNDISKFIRSYQLKQKALKQLIVIYSRHVLSEHFAKTFKSAIALVVLPSLTNIYYAIRSHTLLAGIMPFAVPLICFTNYIYCFNKEMQQFSLTQHQDAELARKQYEIIYQFSYFSRDLESYMSKLEMFRQNENKINDSVI